MVERERSRARDCYEAELAYQAAVKERAYNGRIHVRDDELEWARTRQGVIKYYLNRTAIQDTALKDWIVFVHEIHTHSGKHRHQGGLAIYVIDGQGYTVIDGERHDWKAGDLLLLPIKPGGVEHQHFNTSTDRPARWLALIYKPLHDEAASALEHREDSPMYRR